MSISRRSFLKGTAVAAGSLAFPTIVPSSVFGQNTPSNRINIAAIGMGARGNYVFQHEFLTDRMPDVRCVAVYDCFRDRTEKAARMMNDHYGGEVCTAALSYQDILEREDVDGVVISTPDHWHVPMAYFAAMAKKDVYAEKPLGVAMAWAWRLREAVERNNVVYQFGTQQRSMDMFRRAVNLVRNGYIGKVKHVDAWASGMRCPGWYNDNFEAHYRNTAPAPVPTGLNYDVWNGPAPMKPYTTSRCTQWGAYHIYDYSLGNMAGWGAHPLDIAQWGLDMDHTSPVRYEGKGEFPPEGLFDTIDSWDVNCEYANGVTMRFMCTRAAEGAVAKMDQRRIAFKDHGTTFFGEDGWINVSRHAVYASTPELQRANIGPNDTPVYHSDSQQRNWIDCIKSRAATINPLETGIRSDTICHASDMAIRLGRPIKWNPQKEQVVGDPEAAKMLERPMRSPYSIL